MLESEAPCAGVFWHGDGAVTEHGRGHALPMPRWPELHPHFTAELRQLARREVNNAEAHRALIPIAVELRLRRPSYWTVRRFLIAERERLAVRRRERERFEERVVIPLLSGRAPRLD